MIKWNSVLSFHTPLELKSRISEMLTVCLLLIICRQYLLFLLGLMYSNSKILKKKYVSLGAMLVPPVQLDHKPQKVRSHICFAYLCISP